MAKSKAIPVPVVVAAPPPPKLGLFRNAITEEDGHSVNVGYLTLFWVMAVDITLVPVMVIAAFIQQTYDPLHRFPFTELRDGLIGVGSVFGATLTALGVFLWGDSRKPPPISQTTVATQTLQTTVAPTPAK
jgi:hypothetical protein